MRRNFPWRRRKASLYEQVVSEILLQRTRAETVAAFWPQFIQRFPSWQALACSSVDRIEYVLRPIGLSRQRAPRLRGLGLEMAKRRGQFSSNRQAIEELPGVGQYVANAIFTFAHGKAQPMLDTNMARVIERVFGTRKLADIRYDPYLQALAQAVVNHARGVEMNWAVLDFAALICTIRNPKCHECPLARQCRHIRRGRLNGARAVSS